MKEYLVPAAIGAASGALVGGLVWFLVVRQVDAQVTRVIEREVPPRLRQELDRKFQSIGLTPAMATNIRALLGAADQAGLFSALGQAAGAIRR